MSKPFGALYLILGTCVAAGMLGLPIVTAAYHFHFTVLMMTLAWAIMTLGAWCLLQVNMGMPPRANFTSMAQKTLGHGVKAVTWVIYLMLLISLLCAYLSASSDLVHDTFNGAHAALPRWVVTTLTTILLGMVTYRGIHAVDFVNRFLMSAKLIICFLLIGVVVPFAHKDTLSVGGAHWNTATFLIMVTSFGYGSILPSVRNYLGNNRRQLTRVFWIGSFIPLTLYLIWIAVIQGALSRTSLIAMNNSADTNSLLMTALSNLTHHPVLQSISVIFVSLCAIVGFLSISTSLFDLLSDGFKKLSRPYVAVIALLPPMVIVIFDPSIFIYALAYAGMCCVYMLIILPVAMYVRIKVLDKKR